MWIKHPDFEATQFRIRAVDFDQQSYEGFKNFYNPQFFKENKSLVKLVMTYMNLNTVKQYRLEERNKIATRIRSTKYKIQDLMETMCEDQLSSPQKVKQLAQELYFHYHDKSFLTAKSMGELVQKSIRLLL